MPEPKSDFLRHTLATLAYRAGRALRNAPPEFATYRAGETTRQPVEILAHIGDLLDWAFSIVEGPQRWRDSKPLAWEQEVNRFFAALQKLDQRLASAPPINCSLEKLFQGPIADALTHVGQISMLRRLAGTPAGGENFYVALIETGRVGAEQAKPVREFD